MFEKLNPVSVMTFSIGLIVLGLLVYINTTTQNYKNSEFIINADAVQAYVTGVYTYSYRGTNVDDIFVKYEYENVSHESVYVGSASVGYYKVGDLITVYVDPNNPKIAKIPRNNNQIKEICIIVVGILLLFGSFFIYIKRKSQPVT